MSRSAGPAQLRLDFRPDTLGSALRIPARRTDALARAFHDIHRKLRPRTRLPQIRVAFFESVGANHDAVLEDGILTARVSDLFDDAPQPVFEAIAAILISKLYGKKMDAHYRRVYKEYTTSDPMLKRARQIRLQRGRKPQTTDPRGRWFDLDRLFDEINANYFEGRLPKPQLSWTSRRTRRVLGRYDFDQNVIFISRSLDRQDVPDYVVRYVLFHEMLHVKHGSEIRNHREVFHSAAFRREERRFEWFDVASEWLEAN